MPHIHEKIDFTASAIIIHKNKSLLRYHEKYKIWLTPGGHIELNEDPNQAVVREAKEETGLDIKLIAPTQYESFKDNDSYDLIPPFFVNRHNVTETHEHIDNIFIATTTSDILNPHKDEKPTDFLWLTKEEIQSHPDIGKHMKRLCVFALEFVAKKDI